MAATTLGNAISEAHRLQQQTLAALTTRDLHLIWPAFDPSNIDGSWGQIAPLIEALVRERRTISNHIAAAYFEAFRDAEKVPGTAKAVLASPVPADEIAATLLYTGPITAKKIARVGRTDVSEQTFAFTDGNVSRLIQGGGRDTIIDSVRADTRATRYARVCSGACCAFCAMLAGRGGVYSAENADFAAHRNCGCSAEPVYHDDSANPRQKDLDALWKSSTKGLSGGDARRAFRRAYEAL